MLYKTKTVVVEALQFTVENALEQEPAAGIGDWLVMDQEGKIQIYSDLMFRARYELADPEEVPTRFALERKRKNAGKPRAPKTRTVVSPELE